MQVVEQTAMLDAPMAITLDAVNDIENIPNWATVAGSVDKAPGEGEGVIYNWRFQVGSLTFKGVLAVIEQTGNSLITRSTGDIDSIWTINLTPIAKNSTAIRVSVEYTPPHAFIEPLADLVVQQLASPEVASENMARFKAMVEERAKIAEKEAALAGC